jgi:predicted acyltransferase
MTETAVPSPPGQRLVSLDVLRGFDMLWILGMEEVGVALFKANNAPWARFVAEQLDHAAWAGFRFLDLIFPLFVFIAGVSLVYSTDKNVSVSGRRGAVIKLLKRALLLYVLGLLCYGGLSKGIDAVRWLGVLQRIAICGLAGGLAYLFLKERSRVILTVSLLLGYWALLALVPVPGIGAGHFAEGQNLTNWIDSQYLPGLKWDGNHDPEGLLSTLPAIATALLGVLAGGWLKHHPGSVWRKAAQLATAGAVLAALGWAWHPFFPVIKKIWTSSYVLVAGGYSLMLLALFLAIIDGWKVRRGLQPFLWIGMNPITLYLSHHFFNYSEVSTALLGGPVAGAFGAWGDVLIASGTVLLGIWLAWFLYSRKIFLRV